MALPFYFNKSLICNQYICHFSIKSNPKPRILFVCVANSCRSQLAEVLGQKYLSDFYEVYSAGSTPSEPNELTLDFLKSN